MPLGLVLRLRLTADGTARECWHDYAPGEIVEIQRLAITRLEDRQTWLCQDSSAQLMHFERVCELLNPLKIRRPVGPTTLCA
jgi:hypothetical protein